MNELQLERNDTTPVANSNMHHRHCYRRNYSRCRCKRCAQYSKT